MSVRIVVSLDMASDDPQQAYDDMYEMLSKVCSEENTVIDGWESTDEWFDKDGNQLSQEEVDKARTAILDTHGL